MRRPMLLKGWKTYAVLALVASVGMWLIACGGSSPTEPAAPAVSGDSGGSGTSGTSGDSGDSGTSGDSGDAGTSGGSDGSGGSGGTSSPGTVKIWLTDAPIDEICELWVFLQDVRVKPDGQPAQRLGIVGQAFDLLTLRDGQTALLGDFEVVQGRYQFIEILLDKSPAVTYVIEKEDPSDPNSACLPDPVALQVPSSKIKVSGGPFDVTETTGITIDFDARKSLKRKGGGNGNGNGNGNNGQGKGWQLKPVVTVVDVNQTGDAK